MPAKAGASTSSASASSKRTAPGSAYGPCPPATIDTVALGALASAVAAIGDRPKQPYRAPDAQSFIGAAAPAYVRECLSAPALRAGGCFEPRAVEK
ncbi:MAG: hypothetical protein J0H62_11595, partial [Rhizobiales bacterium]|nr:hypothetical protein [Hyphomicrobiales bacterium]